MWLIHSSVWLTSQWSIAGHDGTDLDYESITSGLWMNTVLIWIRWAIIHMPFTMLQWQSSNVCLDIFFTYVHHITEKTKRREWSQIPKPKRDHPRGISWGNTTMILIARRRSKEEVLEERESGILWMTVPCNHDLSPAVCFFTVLYRLGFHKGWADLTSRPINMTNDMFSVTWHVLQFHRNCNYIFSTQELDD